jgi:hypothetical protein
MSLNRGVDAVQLQVEQPKLTGFSYSKETKSLENKSWISNQVHKEKSNTIGRIQAEENVQKVF